MRLFWMSVVMMPFTLGCSSSGPSETVPDSPSWDGKVRQWGALRDVMHGEGMDGQVRLSEVTDENHVFGIGVPDKLQGEILIADSVAWVARVADGNRVETRQSDSPRDSAAFLAISQVPQWTEVTLDHDVSEEDFDTFIQQTLRHAELDRLETVPFLVKGRFPSLSMHVLNGECPFAEVKAEVEGAGPPRRTKLQDAQGILVGFYSEHGGGRITHHWTSTHVHALVGEGDERMTGHVDAVALQAGNVVRVPVYRSTNTHE